MPMIKLYCSKEFGDEEKKKISGDIIDVVKSVTGKPASYIMVIVVGGEYIRLGGRYECALFEFSQLGNLSLAQKDKLTGSLSDIASNHDIAVENNIYVVFQEYIRENWGYNGKTFASL